MVVPTHYLAPGAADHYRLLFFIRQENLDAGDFIFDRVSRDELSRLAQAVEQSRKLFVQRRIFRRAALAVSAETASALVAKTATA